MSAEERSAYRVLARKYRPQHFGELVGQDALVRTLKNAIENGRTAHAYMLTGVRGVGKTTTARIIARALNYTGSDGKSGPTTGPTDDCEICRAIAADRCPDVMEMDAASRTGIDDIREILDGVRYAPTAARKKIYIIDEVHMLSKAAFNALLKTLEEPPPHVVFIFATTEIRKVPVTVLSRCQRFDLRRVDAPTLIAHYRAICEKESVEIEEEALALIARAADGSVRDGLSLLDQAIAQGNGKVAAALVRDMIGLADRARLADLLESAVKGECAKALEIMHDLYRAGADPLVVAQDMLELTHQLARARAVPDMKDAEERIAALARELSMPALGRTWQILLKGLGELAHAPNPQSAAEMIVIRLAYTADLPDPADLLKRLKNHESTGSGQSQPAAARAPARQPEPVSYGTSGNTAQAVKMQPQAAPALHDLESIEQALQAHGHMILASELYQYVHLVKIEQGRLEIRPQEQARSTLASDLAKALTDISGARWVVSISGAAGLPTLAEKQAARDSALLAEAKANPLLVEILSIFPGTTIEIETDKETG